MREIALPGGAGIEVEVRGSGPVVLLPVDPRPVEGPQADAMRAWGADPELGRSLLRGLADGFRAVAFGYEAHVLAHPRPDTLTPEALVADLLAVADAVGADRFAFYGYSWLGLAGLQLAVRTDRLTALAMGGFPPLGGPYAEMLAVTAATHALAAAPRPVPVPAAEPGDWATADVGLGEPQARQFRTLYEALRDFDDQAALPRVTCPRLAFAGAADVIDYDERWGGVRVDMGPRLAGRAAELTAAGWTVRLLEGLDHTGAMQAAAVLPVLRPWLDSVLRA
ncbi:alpha/beta fold hydrolase [Geodermatophilus sp. SYSU D00815]